MKKLKTSFIVFLLVGIIQLLHAVPTCRYHVKGVDVATQTDESFLATCSICLDSVQDCVAFPCGGTHRFCRTCITRNVRENNLTGAKCPVCRFTLQLDGTNRDHELFFRNLIPNPEEQDRIRERERVYNWESLDRPVAQNFEREFVQRVTNIVHEQLARRGITTAADEYHEAFDYELHRVLNVVVRVQLSGVNTSMITAVELVEQDFEAARREERELQEDLALHETLIERMLLRIDLMRIRDVIFRLSVERRYLPLLRWYQQQQYRRR